MLYVRGCVGEVGGVVCSRRPSLGGLASIAPHPPCASQSIVRCTICQRQGASPSGMGAQLLRAFTAHFTGRRLEWDGVDG